PRGACSGGHRSFRGALAGGRGLLPVGTVAAGGRRRRGGRRREGRRRGRRGCRRSCGARRGRCGGGCGFARRHRGGGISPRRSPGPRSLAAGRVLRIRAAGGSASLPARVGTVLPDGTLSAGSPVARSTTTTRTTRAARAVVAGRVAGTGVIRPGTARTVPSRSSAGGAWT